MLKRDYGQNPKPHPSPHTLEQCVDELQVTNGYRGKGMYFGISDECAKIWYAGTIWHYKSIVVVNKNTDKTGAIRQMTNNENYKMSCGR